MREFDYELIYRYINDEMQLAERDAFEKQLAEDEALRAEVMIHKDLYLGVQMAADEELKANISNVHQELSENGFLSQALQASSLSDTEKKETKIRRLSMRNFFAIAATVLLLMTISYFIFKPDTSAQAIFASHYAKDTIIIVEQLDMLSLQGMAIRDRDRRDNLKVALELYQDENYNAAAEHLSQHLTKFPEDDAAQLFYGLSLIELEEFKAAIDQLKTLSETPESEYQYASIWYIGLAYLQVDVETAKETFVQLAQKESSVYQKRAKKILELLK